MSRLTDQPSIHPTAEAYFTALPETDMECFNAFTGGGYVGWEEVDQSFYQTIIDARRSVIGQ